MHICSEELQSSMSSGIRPYLGQVEVQLRTPIQML